MSESENPFASPEKRVKPAAQRANYVAWGVAVLAIMVALFILMVWSQGKTDHEREMNALRSKLDTTARNLTNALALNLTNADLMAALKTQVSDLEKQRDAAGQMAKSLESEMRADLESKDVTISNLQGKLTVTILDRVMFDSGEAVLKPDGAAVMQKIATILQAHPELKIHIIGHTDNVPIRQTAQNKFASNWELSSARALAAVHFLTERAGVDPRRVGAVGYGEFRPIADNSTPEGRAKNRRIAITILPDELAAADTAAAAKAKEVPIVTPSATSVPPQ